MIKYPISTHTFMMPIRWDYLPKGFTKEKWKFSFDFEERTSLIKIHKLLISSGWNRKFYKIDNDVKRYNEISYFHSYATRTLFDMQYRSETTVNDLDDHKIMVYYEKRIDKNDGSYYQIQLHDGTEYRLTLTDINLHVYNTGVMILTFVCENHNSNYSKEDILKINEYGRRIYPAFLDDGNSNLTETVKTENLASKLTIYAPLSNIQLEEDFSWYDNLNQNNTFHLKGDEYIYSNFIIFPKIITGLFNNKFTFDAEGESEEKVRCNIIGDDRMFFQCWYGSNSLANRFKKYNKSTSDYNYEVDKYWYAFIFGDADAKWPTMQNEILIKQDIQISTYGRWANYGTLYGFSRDSFAAISGSIDKIGVPLDIHFTSIYYQMAVLSLAQRASILKFSSEVANLSDLGKSKPYEAAKKIEVLYLNYIEFINKIYHREITPTIQGIEMYDKFHDVMRIQRDADALKSEIAELHNFADMVKQDRLTMIATYFLPFSLVFGILGSNFLDPTNMKIFNLNVNINAFIWLGIGIVSALILGKIANRIFNKIQNKKLWN
jgi:hypothetical protein